MWQRNLANELSEAKHGARRAVIAKYQELTGLSSVQLYRIAGENGFLCKRKKRSDKGNLRSGLTEDQLKFLAGLMYTTRRENKGPIMPAETAWEIAVDNGIVQPGQIAPGSLNRLLREHQISKERMKDPTPHTEMRSLHPNHCHLVDVSVCIQYYLRDGRMGIMDERDFYKNKPHAFAKVKQKLLRYVLDDHFSGLFLFRYYVAEGESRENLWDFLKWAWRAKEDSRLPFRGVPSFLLMDAGSAQTSHAMKNFFNGLMIERPKGKPYNPRRQGGVETVHNIIENNFETRLRICPAHSVEELNAWAMDFMIYHHAAKIHRRHGMTRLASWLLIKPKQLRDLPDDDVLDLIYREPAKECTVRNYLFSYQGESFRIKHLPGMHHNAKVMVSVNPYRWKSEQVVTVLWQDAAYDVQAVKKLPAEQGGFSEHAAIIGQEYKSQPETSTQQAVKTIEGLAYGEQGPKKGSIPFEGLTVFGHQAEKVVNLSTMPKRGVPIEIARPTGPALISIMEFFKRLRNTGTIIAPEMNRELREAFGEAIESKHAETVIAAIVSGTDWRQEIQPEAYQSTQ